MPDWVVLLSVLVLSGSIGTPIDQTSVPVEFELDTPGVIVKCA